MRINSDRLGESAKLYGEFKESMTEEKAEVMKTIPKKPNESGVELSKDSLDALEQLGIVLKTIYIRLKKEGYRIVDGKMINVNEEKKSNRSRYSEGYSKRKVP